MPKPTTGVPPVVLAFVRAKIAIDDGLKQLIQAGLVSEEQFEDAELAALMDLLEEKPPDDQPRPKSRSRKEPSR